MCISVVRYRQGIPCQQCSKDEMELICFAIYEKKCGLYSWGGKLLLQVLMTSWWLGNGSQLCTYHIFSCFEYYDGCTLGDIIDDTTSYALNI